jgi:23S rRNA (guanosine2251-2'-O)-methyltransferase
MGELIIGRIPVLECLRAKRRRCFTLYLLRGGKGLDEFHQAAGPVSIKECDRNTLDRMAQGQVHQGVILEANPLPVRRADDWIKRDFPADAVVVLLDGIEDPHNFGAIVRTAVACGVHGIVFGKDRAAPLSPAALKSAAGAMEYAELVQATNLVRTMEGLQRAGFWLAALEEQGDQTIWQADLTGRACIVIGSEGKGLRRLVRERCDLHVRIPLPGALTTLNASVSAAIALTECLRQRVAKG